MTIAIWIIAILLGLILIAVLNKRLVADVIILGIKILAAVIVVVSILFLLWFSWNFYHDQKAREIEQATVEQQNRTRQQLDEIWNNNSNNASSLQVNKQCYDYAFKELLKGYSPEDPTVISDGTITHSQEYLNCIGEKLLLSY